MMARWNFLLVAALFPVLFSLQGKAVGFESGSTFTATDRYGIVTVTCPPIPSVFHSLDVTCQQTQLAPVSYDTFVGPFIAADTVTITSDQGQTGASVSQSSVYANGQGTVPFNLWTAALFQTPLLGEGTNHLQYSLSLSGQIVQQGTFIVQVNSAPAQICIAATVSGNADEICNDPFTSCQRYFAQANCH